MHFCTGATRLWSNVVLVNIQPFALFHRFETFFSVWNDTKLENFAPLSSYSPGYWRTVPYFNGAHLPRSFKTQPRSWRLSWRPRRGVWCSICQTTPPLITPIYAASALLPQVHSAGWGAESAPPCSPLLYWRTRQGFSSFPNPKTPDPAPELIIILSLRRNPSGRWPPRVELKDAWYKSLRTRSLLQKSNK